MDLFELHTELRIHVPAKGRTEEASAKVVHAILGIAKHDSEVFRDVLQQDM